MQLRNKSSGGLIHVYNCTAGCFKGEAAYAGGPNSTSTNRNVNVQYRTSGSDSFAGQDTAKLSGALTTAMNNWNTAPTERPNVFATTGEAQGIFEIPTSRESRIIQTHTGIPNDPMWKYNGIDPKTFFRELRSATGKRL